MCLCLVCGFHQFSMARVHSRPRRASASFFTCTRSARSRVRVRVCVRVCVPSTWFCPVFHGAGPFPSTTGVGQIFHVYPFTGPCKGPCVCLCLVCGFHQFSMARVHSRPRWASASFSHVLVQPVHGSVYVCVCLVRGFAQFSMARVHSRPRRASARFFTCTRSLVRLRVRVCVCA